MPIPDFQSLMLPLLEHVGDGAEYTIAGSRDILADRYNLSEEERSQRLPSGAANTFYNRLAWAKTYLERAGLLIKVKRGVFKISPTGIALLRNPPEKIDINYLQRFEAFNEFRKKNDGNQYRSHRTVTPQGKRGYTGRSVGPRVQRIARRPSDSTAGTN